MRAKKCFDLIFFALALAYAAINADAQQDAHQPLYQRDISALVPPGVRRPGVFDGTVGFLDDDSLAVGLCYKATCNVATFRLGMDGLQQIATLNDAALFHTILRSDGGLLLGGVRRGRKYGAVLLNQQLQMSRWIPTTPGFSIYGDKIPEGKGLLLAHTKGLAAFLDQQVVTIKGSDGQVLGTFPASSGRSSPWVTFLDKERILFDQGGEDAQVRDFDGRVLKVLKKPGEALGVQIRQAADGNALLYDSFVRRVGLGQAAREKALIAATMGLSTDGDVPNGEVVRVIDTSSGKSCFEWFEKENLLPPFVAHADISPSGHLVAIITQRTLSIFAVPAN